MSKTFSVAYCAVMLALAMALSYIESLIPPPIPLPGIKLGLANIAVLFVLLEFSTGHAAAVSFLRVFLSALIFGNASGFIMSLCGAALSFAVMWGLKLCRIFSAVGISAGGAAAHNFAQICASALITGSTAVFYYLPFLLLVAIPCGIMSGFIVLAIQRAYTVPKKR